MFHHSQSTTTTKSYEEYKTPIHHTVLWTSLMNSEQVVLLLLLLLLYLNKLNLIKYKILAHYGNVIHTNTERQTFNKWRKKIKNNME